MAYVVTGEPDNARRTDFSREHYDYEYPEGLDLKPGSEFHIQLRNKIWQRAREARNEMSKRFNSWNEIDRILTVYMPLKEKEILVQQKDSAKPVSVVFPYSYSMLEALLTYLTMAFFQDPMFQYEGVGPEDVRGSMLMELVVRLQCIKTKVPLAVHTVMRDSLAYGIGIGVPGWEVKYGKRPFGSNVILQSPSGEQNYSDVHFVDDVVFEGNSLSNVDPYMWFPDPSVSAHRVQDGEYVGWMVRDNLMSLLAEEQTGNRLFNVRYLKGIRQRKSSLSVDQSNRNIKHGGTDPRLIADSTNPVDVIYMYINLIPEEWKLGKGEYPEKWLFGLASDEVIISAEKIGHAHNMYPVAVAAPEFDGYSPTPIGRLEILYGLQHTLDWLFNSHIANVRKAINDMLVVDPFLVNINDLKDPQPGKLIRLRRPAWGKGVDKVVQQLQVNDITRLNISDSAYITQWMDRISGADQSMMGSLRQGGPERLTRSEFQGTRGSAVSRLQRIAMILGMQFMQDVGYMFAVHTQQYMSKDTYVKLAGRNQEQLHTIFGPKDRVAVTPYDLAVDYDVIVRDGSIPGGNFSESWIELFKIIGSSPELMAQFDVTRIFTFIASQMGAKNVEDFRRNVSQIQPQTMSDETVLREADKGNLIPMGLQ